jgi:hypothetical protein
MVVSTAEHIRSFQRRTWVADHPILFTRCPNALGGFCGCAVTPSILVAFGHFSKVRIHLHILWSAMTNSPPWSSHDLTFALSL